MEQIPRPVVLIIMDGFGNNPSDYGNAVTQAKKTNLNKYFKEYPTTELLCSGKNVGLPPGTMGNSEVGHIHIGCGRSVFQPLQMVNNAIEDGTFYKNEKFMNALDHCKKNDSNLHLMGLFSDKGVHSTCVHLHHLLEMCKRENFGKVFIHLFLDGRDVPEKSAHIFLKSLQENMEKTKIGEIATIAGRYYAMDRDLNWDRTQESYELMTEGKGFKETDALTAIQNAYKRGDETDYYVKPIVMMGKDDNPVGLVKENDSIIFINYRSDRSRQITRAFMEEKFPGWEREKLKNLHFVCMSEYDKHFGLPVAFPQVVVKNNLSSVLSKNKKTQLRIAETEKYAHVTFFFNSQIEEPYEFEDRIMVQSPKVKSYDLKPEMSAYEVTEKLVKGIDSKKYDCVMVNFANCDLVGHAGKLDAAIKAVEVVDECVGKVVDAALRQSGVVLITADHGNSEQMMYEDGSPQPAHTTFPVPLCIVSNHKELSKGNMKFKKRGELIDITPTILHLLKIPKHEDMNGKSLIEH